MRRCEAARIINSKSHIPHIKRKNHSKLLLYNKIEDDNGTKNGDILNPKLLENCFIMQNRRMRLDYRATESWLFSVTKLIW